MQPPPSGLRDALRVKHISNLKFAMSIIYYPIIVSLFALGFVVFLIMQINKAAAAKDKAVAITAAIKEGAMSFLKRQYKTVAVVAAALFIALWIILGWKIAFGFLLGAVLSGLSGF